MDVQPALYHGPVLYWSNSRLDPGVAVYNIYHVHTKKSEVVVGFALRYKDLG